MVPSCSSSSSSLRGASTALGGGAPPAASILLRRSPSSINTNTNHRRAANARAAALRPRALLSVFQPPAAAKQQAAIPTTVPADCQKAQDQILAALSSAKGRGREGLSPEQLAALDAAVEQLERSGKGLADAASQPALDGRWRLVFTSRPGSASPIQRTFVGVDAFSVFQDVSVVAGDGAQDEEDAPPRARVDNVVVFGRGGERQGAWGYLRVEAQASTQARPLPGFTPRQGAGLPLFGKSFNVPPAAGPGARVDFAFDRAAFNLWGGKVKVPYPVPFRLLGDERKGWLDVTYLSRDGRFRLSRGNKGTLFVLLKEEDQEDEEEDQEQEDQEQDGDEADDDRNEEGEAEAAASARPASPANAFFARLFSPPPPAQPKAPPPPAVDDVLAAARASAAAPSDADKAGEALSLVERLVAGQGRGSVRRPARNAKAVHGTWRLVWTQQSESASALQRWGTSRARSTQVIDALDRGLAMNVVDLRPFAEVRAYARCEPRSDTRTGVRIESGEVILAPGVGGAGGGGEGEGEGGGGLLRFALPIKGADDGYVEWLYLDGRVRVTRGSKGSLFLHVRESDDATSIPDF